MDSYIIQKADFFLLLIWLFGKPYLYYEDLTFLQEQTLDVIVKIFIPIYLQTLD